MENSAKTRLNLGCGKHLKQGYINIDLYSQTDGVVIQDIRKLLDYYKPGTIDEIYASDVIEHISHKEVKEVLSTWCSLLKPGGKIYIKTPDALKQAQCLLDGTWNVEIYSHMVYGGQENEGNIHLTTFTMEHLEKLLKSNGITVYDKKKIHHNLVCNRGSFNANIEVTGTKNDNWIR